MQVGLSQLILGDLSCNEFFTQAASAGYEVVEVCMQKEGELMPGMSEDAARQIVGQAEQAEGACRHAAHRSGTLRSEQEILSGIRLRSTSPR